MQAQQMIGPTNMVIRRNGYLYVYLSNESNQFVDFDNLVINHRRGPLTEQKDYYAFGMEIPGLSSQAFKPTYVANRNRYNGKEIQSLEFTDSTSLNWDDYGARMYDPQIGRWMINDPLSDKMRRWSGYNFAFDNPMKFIDPDGMGPYGVEGMKDDFTAYEVSGGWVSYKDQYGQKHTDWNSKVNSQTGAEKWAASKGKDINGNQKNTDVTYIGKEGFVTNAFDKDGQSASTYKLNADGTSTRLGESDAIKSEVKPDKSSDEPKASPSPADDPTLNKIATQSGVFSLEAGLIEAATKYGKGAVEDVAPVAGKVKFAFRGLAVVTGGIATYQAAKELFDKPTWGNFFKFVGNATITGVAVFGELNPFIAVGLAVLDLSGASDGLYKTLGKFAGDK